MNIDLHSHFFPVEALGNPGSFSARAPTIAWSQGKLTVTSGGGMRGNLAAGAYDADARITALDELRIDLQAISPSPILLFYWEEPTTRWQWVTLILSEKSGCSTYPTKIRAQYSARMRATH
jgi:hypothetical protein